MYFVFLHILDKVCYIPTCVSEELMVSLACEVGGGWGVVRSVPGHALGQPLCFNMASRCLSSAFEGTLCSGYVFVQVKVWKESSTPLLAHPFSCCYHFSVKRF